MTPSDEHKHRQAWALLASLPRPVRVEGATPTGALNRLGRRTRAALERRRYDLSPVKAALLKELSA